MSNETCRPSVPRPASWIACSATAAIPARSMSFIVKTCTRDSRTRSFSLASRFRTPMSTVCSGLTFGEKPPMHDSSVGSGPRSAASGIPWTLPLVLLDGVFMSPCASTQMRPSGRSARRAISALAATDPAARLWSPPRTSGSAPASRLASAASYSVVQTRAMSRMYFLRSSPGCWVSGIGTSRSPLSTTAYPSSRRRTSSPVMRSAEGPMSTPRRPPPRSSGTPMMWMGTTVSAALPAYRHALAGRRDDGGEQVGVRFDRAQEVLHLVAFIDDVVREEQATLGQARVHEIEELLVVRLPRVEEHEVNRPLQLRNLLERIPAHHGDHVVQARAADICLCFPGPHRVELDRRQLAAGLPQAQSYPDRAVAAGRSDFERVLRAARGNHEAEKPAILFGDGQLALVGPPNLLQQAHQGRGDARRRPWCLCCGRKDRGEHRQDEQDGELLGHVARSVVGQGTAPPCVRTTAYQSPRGPKTCWLMADPPIRPISLHGRTMPR